MILCCFARPAIMSSDAESGLAGSEQPLHEAEHEHPNRRVRYNLSVDTQNIATGSDVRRSRSHSQQHDDDGSSSPNLKRRLTRTATFKPIDDYEEFEAYSARPGWQPGSEPGFDPRLPDGGHASMPTLSAPCEITVVDFSVGQMKKRHFDNQSFVTFLNEPQPKWAKCRWINVNGLSWDVIQAIGAKKGLHRLALEDIMNTRNRTKAEWYSNHAFIILTLQKLVHLVDEDSSDSDTESMHSTNSKKTSKGPFKKWWRSGKEAPDPEQTRPSNGVASRVPSSDLGLHQTAITRTLQRYHASANEVRTEFMEQHSSLMPYRMAVSAEQVSIFLTSDNTVVSFFENSAGDIERPIVSRLSDHGTILRESYDGSLLVQAIIDAIVDLAIPLTAVYTDIIGDIELDVLTSPDISQSRRLYICMSEINKMLSFLNPVDNLVNVLRDHKTHMSQENATKELTNPASGVIVTPMTTTYLGDVLDHCIIITEALQQLKRSSDDLIDLIFNTISATQNESLKQLTVVTIIFLPMTFITGFFGQNFEDFPEIKGSISWACAVPTAVATILILMRDIIWAWLTRLVQRKDVLSARRRRQNRKRFRTR
ncbi:Cobalt/magnesium transport protein CorA [Paramyrothecium foliicola]|nr:Cobalt/magnesium transport protein CorA [Paramyrothecium foliicola]